MTGAPTTQDFHDIRGKVGRFGVLGKTLLVPDMAPFGARLLAATFRAFGANARVMETYTGLQLGKEHTSGKECFPCQVTLGDILHHLAAERLRRGASFAATDYIYFMPGASGPCRFGMYAMLQRLILDRFPEYQGVLFTGLSTEDGYAVDGLVPADRKGSFRKLAYSTVILADCLDRMVWRARPYESRPGAVDELAEQVVSELCARIEADDPAAGIESCTRILEAGARACATLIDRRLPRRPLIGVIGEIYLRSHPDSNQHIIRDIERCGGEVVNASLAEWINYVNHETGATHRRRASLALRRRDGRKLKKHLGGWLASRLEAAWTSRRAATIYAAVFRHLDVQPDHPVDTLERQLAAHRVFSFDITTESGLSIGAALEHLHEGIDGMVNVYPFTCMPGTTASAILSPLFREHKVPYLDAPCDGTTQPGRETALRTFLFQARQRRDLRKAVEPRGHDR